MTYFGLLTLPPALTNALWSERGLASTGLLVGPRGGGDPSSWTPQPDTSAARALATSQRKWGRPLPSSRRGIDSTCMLAYYSLMVSRSSQEVYFLTMQGTMYQRGSTGA